MNNDVAIENTVTGDSMAPSRTVAGASSDTSALINVSGWEIVKADFMNLNKLWLKVPMAAELESQVQIRTTESALFKQVSSNKYCDFSFVLNLQVNFTIYLAWATTFDRCYSETKIS
ncbi:unnamed protein product [Allacma fusca]|uniref:Uncharacterized protein n=1 Tax=Allacma fusca TaxID=39272 RepID=A0A8J2PK25_9HEXA|nr:unnamed protein product [Allacma fusca]